MRIRAPVAVAWWSVLLATGCAGWRRTQLSEGDRLPPRQQVQVWQNGLSRVVHAGLVAHDTLYAVPFTKPPSCDTCRIAIALSEVDSVRLGNQERTGFVLGMLPFAALGGLLVVFLLSYGSD